MAEHPAAALVRQWQEEGDVEEQTRTYEALRKAEMLARIDNAISETWQAIRHFPDAAELQIALESLKKFRAKVADSQ